MLDRGFVSNAKQAILVANEALKVQGKQRDRDEYAKIVAYTSLGLNEDALKEISHLPAAKLDEPDTLAILAENYTATKQREKALECYDKMLKISKSNSAHFARGRLLKELGKAAEGEADMKAATDAHYIEPPEGSRGN